MEKEQSKAKRIGNIVFNVVLWLFVAFAVVITVVAFSAGANAKNVPTLGGKCYLNVQSNSMNAEKPADLPEGKFAGFKKGTMIIGEYIAESDEAIDALKVGDIVTYEWDINGDGMISSGEYNTHRIVGINRDANGRIVTLATQGDNHEMSLGTEEVQRSALIARYTGKKIGGLGGVLTFLGSQLGFGLCILLPMVLFFGYELFVFIKLVIKTKNEGKKVISAEDEELIKQKAIEEYLRQTAAAQQTPPAEDASAAPKDTTGESDPPANN